MNGPIFDDDGPGTEEGTPVSDSEMARAEAEIGGALARLAASEQTDVERSVMTTLRPSLRRRRLIGMVPVVAASGVTLCGAALLGGIPGGGMVGHLPRWSSAAGLQVLSTVQGWHVALATTASLDLGIGLQTASVAAALIGATAVGALVHRWRRVAAWRPVR